MLITVKARPEEVQSDTKTHSIFLFKKKKSRGDYWSEIFLVDLQIFWGFLTEVLNQWGC